ncbi:MAG TPA: hypothetical protein VFN42_09870 [Acetobacteraceae bacterium]|nr:hypothetical protein [Acetobacteraceae bacterium]
MHTNDCEPSLCLAALRSLTALSAFLDVSSLNLAAPQSAAIFLSGHHRARIRLAPGRRRTRGGAERDNRQGVQRSAIPVLLPERVVVMVMMMMMMMADDGMVMMMVVVVMRPRGA